MAEICGQLLKKGIKVYVEGRLQTRDWTGDDGKKRYKTEVIIDDMIILSPKKDGVEGEEEVTEEDFVTGGDASGEEINLDDIDLGDLDSSN
ncbi:MAG: Single-stranded DNA-binding protein [candidate division WWE3 bacterium GW2011_GWC1_44_308]|nr:MAG: Single-stranded DNA-binding protein [candidate division WWE3 bacterium GW2011_GWD1_43_201]KKT64463.1 MAG: Single-stranded DNA-binding protein [candidate division WWE3 bacterium GW2011_GWC1_44_308]